MANQKQDGSNVGSVEYSTGRCRTMCEQCFVNYGQQGCTAVHNITNTKAEKWFEYAKAEGKRTGLWKPTTKNWDRSRLAGYDYQSAFNIPKSANSGGKPPKRRKKTVDIQGYPFPYFLRVSAQSDSSWAPLDWLSAILAVYGDYCFFNSAIRSIQARPQALREVFHKLVVTTNGGLQKPPPINKPKQKLAAKDKEEENIKYILGSMGKAEAKGADFLHPMSLTDLARTVSKLSDLERYENLVKFYRLRAMPTIEGRLEVYAPVLVTQMRFKSALHIMEFARRYDCDMQIFTADKKYLKLAQKLASKGLAIEGNPTDLPTVIRIRNNSPDNVSEGRGEWTELHRKKGFYRSWTGDFPYNPWVCDRAMMGCSACGLCASLDGTQHGDTNALNVMPNGQILAPRPFEAGYMEVGDGDASDYFDAILSEGTGEDWNEGDADWFFHRNPAEMEEQSQDWIFDALQRVASYVTTGVFCEGWNTHEDANALTAYCVWCLMRKAKRARANKGQAFEGISQFLDDATGDVNILDGVEGLAAMWDDESPWTDEFGTTEV